MPRDRQRACLNDGLKLDLNRLARRQMIRRGLQTGWHGISWTHSYWGEIASGRISADLSGERAGWFKIQLGDGAIERGRVGRRLDFDGGEFDHRCAEAGEQ